MNDFAAAHRRWGYKRAWARAKSEGIVVGRDTFRRLWRTEGLRVRPRKAHKPRTAPRLQRLVEAPDIFLKALRHPLSPNLPKVRFGSKPADGGNLIVEAEDYPQVAADPIAAKYLPLPHGLRGRSRPRPLAPMDGY